MATELLHDQILRVAFLANPSRPTWLSSEDVFWKLENPQLSLVKIRECMEWLVQRGDMAQDLGRFGLTAIKFFELRQQFAHVSPQGIALWLAPIAPIHVPVPSAVAPPVQAPITPAPIVQAPATALPTQHPQHRGPEPMIVAPMPIVTPASQLGLVAQVEQVVGALPQVALPETARVGDGPESPMPLVVASQPDPTSAVPVPAIAPAQYFWEIPQALRYFVVAMLAVQAVLLVLLAFPFSGDGASVAINLLRLASLAATSLSILGLFQILRKGRLSPKQET
jgi:Family of unknown function (DUF5457)